MRRKIISTIRRIWKMSVMDNDTLRFIRHNRETWCSWDGKRRDSIILADFYRVYETIIAFSYFLNILARQHKAAIKTFGPPQKITSRVLHKIYRSFNTKDHIFTVLNKDQKRRVEEILRQVTPGIKTKQDVFDLNVMGIWIGVDVYETYLKDYNKPTVYLDDPNLFKVIEKGVGLVVFWHDYFAKNKVSAAVISHDCYLYFNVVCKVAYKHKVPVYFPNPIYITRAKRPYTIHSYFPDYRKMFNRLPSEEQKKGIELARVQIQKRLSGEVGVDMPHNTKSAFHSNHNRKPVLRKSDNIKVLICSHCFYDNPHAYGGILFLDFYEWLNYLGKISEKTDYDWYLKMHPDPLPGTFEVIQGILSKFPKITLIPHETSYHQLVAEGLNFVLTVYGSVGEECPALGIQVINAGYNPRIAYDFNWHPKTLEEYENCLKNLNKFRKDINLQEVYEAYFMHH